MEHYDGPEKDLIPVAFMYLPILKEQIEQFVRLWKIHKIRNHPERPYFVPGKPVLVSIIRS